MLIGSKDPFPSVRIFDLRGRGGNHPKIRRRQNRISFQRNTKIIAASRDVFTCYPIPKADGLVLMILNLYFTPKVLIPHLNRLGVGESQERSEEKRYQFFHITPSKNMVTFFDSLCNRRTGRWEEKRLEMGVDFFLPSEKFNLRSIELKSQNRICFLDGGRISG